MEYRVKIKIGVIVDADNKDSAIEKAATEVCNYTGDYLGDAEITVEPYRESGQESEFALGCFTGLVPCWVNAPSVLHPAHKYHGKNIVAVKEKGGYRCCAIDEENPVTFHLPENTRLEKGWLNR